MGGLLGGPKGMLAPPPLKLLGGGPGPPGPPSSYAYGVEPKLLYQLPVTPTTPRFASIHCVTLNYLRCIYISDKIKRVSS